MAYNVDIISTEEMRCLREECASKILFTSKSDINGICIQLYTADREHIEMWNDNLYSASDKMRSHARIYSVKDESGKLNVKFDPHTNTAILFNFDYYGWIKSIALGISGLILETSHDIYSVHGAAISLDGIGVSLIAPSKTGKTTQSWGLLRTPNSGLISDDWYFVTLCGGRPMISGSEMNCYIDADIGDVWTEFQPLVKNVRFDNKGRGIANVRWVTGSHSVIPYCTMRYVILMKRDSSDECAMRQMSTDEAVEYLKSNDFCNPHQIIRDEFRLSLREAFFRKYFDSCEVYLVNTIRTAQETQEMIRDTILESCRLH